MPSGAEQPNNPASGLDLARGGVMQKSYKDKKMALLAEGTDPRLRLSSGVCGPLSDILVG